MHFLIENIDLAVFNLIIALGHSYSTLLGDNE